MTVRDLKELLNDCNDEAVVVTGFKMGRTLDLQKWNVEVSRVESEAAQRVGRQIFDTKGDTPLPVEKRHFRIVDEVPEGGELDEIVVLA